MENYRPVTQIAECRFYKSDGVSASLTWSTINMPLPEGYIPKPGDVFKTCLVNALETPASSTTCCTYTCCRAKGKKKKICSQEYVILEIREEGLEVRATLPSGAFVNTNDQWFSYLWIREIVEKPFIKVHRVNLLDIP